MNNDRKATLLPEQVNYIERVITKFYSMAINDIFIGYHFRKISQQSTQFEQDLSFFSEHLARINSFWLSQLLAIPRGDQNKSLFEAHEYLNIKKGELGRWLKLFKEVLEVETTTQIEKEIEIKWLHKLDQFEKAFMKYFFLNN